VSLQFWENAHACCRKQEEGCVRDIGGRNFLKRMAEELVEVFWSDIVRVFAEC
jgi:hypothetical protein